MSLQIGLLDPFNYLQPGPFISQYSDWILFTLLLFFFWAVVGISLRKKFEEGKYLRTLVTALALMLAVGTYYSIYQGWLHLSLEGLGFFGAILLFIVIFFVIFGLMRGYGMRISNALPLGFALLYVSLWAVVPNIFYTISEILPLINGILLVLFIVSVFKVVRTFFRHSRSPLDTAKNLQKADFANEGDVTIDREIAEDKKEIKDLKKGAMKLTKLDINTLEDIDHYLQRMIKVIREKGNTVDREEIAELTKILHAMGRKENVLRKGGDLIKKHIDSYKAMHRKDIPELEKRFSETTDKKQKRLIEEELTYQNQMLQVLDFMEKYESRILEFTDAFNRLLATAMQRLKSAYPNDALAYLEKARQSLQEMQDIYDKQRDFEKYLLKLNKKTITDLKKEKDR